MVSLVKPLCAYAIESDMLYYICTGNGCNRTLSHPPNGRVQIHEIQGILLAVYTCDDSLVDTVRWECLANSTWSGPQPFCPCK